MQGIVDRIEEELYVVELEDGTMINIEKDKILEDVKLGDVVDVEFEDGEVIEVRKNEEQTEDRKKYIEDLTKDMWE